MDDVKITINRQVATSNEPMKYSKVEALLKQLKYKWGRVTTCSIKQS